MTTRSFSIQRGRPARMRRWLAGITVASWLLAGVLPGTAEAQQPEHGPAPAPTAHDIEATQYGEAEHGETIWSFLARISNFAILAGGLYYLLRSPLGRYLEARGQQIRSDLQHAADTRREASARLAQIEARLTALPAEVEALKARGREEIAAEQARIKQAAEAEQQRLVEQTRREIERQLQIARRDLTVYAADLAVGVARARLAGELTPDQQARLIDRYVDQVEAAHEQ